MPAQIDGAFAPFLDQADELDSGGLRDMTMLSSMPPAVITIDEGAEPRVKFEKQPDDIDERAVLVQGVALEVTHLVGGDAAFLMQLAGVSLSSKCNQLFNLEPREDKYKLYAVDVLPANESARDYARRVKPSSFDSTGESWFLDLILLAMRADSNLISHDCTKIPDTVEEVTITGDTRPRKTPQPMGRGRRRRNAAAAAADTRGAGEHTEEPKKVWARKDLRELRYDHEGFSPAQHAFDGALEGAADLVFSKPVAIRVPIVHDEIARHLSDCAGKTNRSTPLERVLVCCSLHGDMRGTESCMNLLNAVRARARALPAPPLPRRGCRRARAPRTRSRSARRSRRGTRRT